MTIYFFLHSIGGKPGGFVKCEVTICNDPFSGSFSASGHF